MTPFKDRDSRVPVWTKTPPSAPGLYWFKLRINENYPPEGVTRFCRVWSFNKRLVVSNQEGSIPVDTMQRWWAGPLLEPDDWTEEGAKAHGSDS